jgi:hypothetical protein
MPEPSGKFLEKLYRFAKRHGPATSADTFLRAITREHEQISRRYREALILSPENVQEVRALLRELWQFEEANGNVDPQHDPVRRNYLLKLAERLCLNGRKDLIPGEDE